MLLRGGLDSIWQSVQAERKVTAEKNPDPERCELQGESEDLNPSYLGLGFCFEGLGYFVIEKEFQN